MFNKKAQMGKIITAFPVIVSLFIIMAGFIIITLFMKASFGPSALSTLEPSFVRTQYLNEESLGGGGILMETISINNENLMILYALLELKKRIHTIPVDFDGNVIPYYNEFIKGLQMYDVASAVRFEPSQCIYLHMNNLGTDESRYPLFLYGVKGNMQLAYNPGDYYDPTRCTVLGDVVTSVRIGEHSFVYYYGSCKQGTPQEDISCIGGRDNE
jgi:hypothetical protein